MDATMPRPAGIDVQMHIQGLLTEHTGKTWEERKLAMHKTIEKSNRFWSVGADFRTGAPENEGRVVPTLRAVRRYHQTGQTKRDS